LEPLQEDTSDQEQICTRYVSKYTMIKKGVFRFYNTHVTKKDHHPILSTSFLINRQVIPSFVTSTCFT
jgi:hypothetical protein